MSKSNAANAYISGGIIAYPTEAVFGLGCDPDNDDAIRRLLKIKQRPEEKGLILLAGDFDQLLPYIDISQFSKAELATIRARWPDGITQVMPKNKTISPLLSGKFDTIAVRLTSQADVVALCAEVNRPIVSTSANLTGLEPAKTWQQLDPQLTAQIDFVLEEETLGFDKPSTIIDAITGETFRS